MGEVALTEMVQLAHAAVVVRRSATAPFLPEPHDPCVLPGLSTSAKSADGIDKWHEKWEDDIKGELVALDGRFVRGGVALPRFGTNTHFLANPMSFLGHAHPCGMARLEKSPSSLGEWS